ncbi:dihydroneopterin aldolase [Sphingomonadaceae bacterium jetA1]|uniref:dihydroneopterin aldolase n=1 Tax=Facivitalis istanbulensis TaxID=3075838 RepID=UPI00348E6444
MYVIRLKNCCFFAHHGVFDEEERLGQRFQVDVELKVEAPSALDSDMIGETVDYGLVFAEIERILSGRRRFLIEALALDIARALCDRFVQVVQARIVLRKPNAPVRGVLDHVEVEVAWPQGLSQPVGEMGLACREMQGALTQSSYWLKQGQE